MAKRVNPGNDVWPAQSAGQIPVATANSNGRLIYEPLTATLPTPTPSDVGKVLAIDTVTSSGVTYKYETLTPIDPLILSIFNQNGVLLPSAPASNLSFTFAAKNLTIVGIGNSAVFYNATTQVRTSVAIAGGVTAITTTGDATYVFINPDGTIGQVHATTDPADFKTVNYLCKVYHPDGGNIVGVKPIYTILSTPQESMRDYGYGLGVMAQGFYLSHNASNTNGNLFQLGKYPVVSGYNINPTDPMPSQRLFPYLSSSNISFQYWSWNPSDRVASTDSLVRSYKLDFPFDNTSTPITAGHFGIVTLLAGSDGSYVFVAPQTTEYTTMALAKADILNYLGSLRLPQFLLEQYDSMGAIVVPPNLTSPVSTNSVLVMLNSVSPGGAPKDDLLPPPTTAGVVKVLPSSNAYSIQPDVPAPVVDLTGFVNGDILGVTAGKIAPVKPDAIFPVAPFKDAERGYFRVIGNTVSHVAQNLANSGITITVSDVAGGFKQAVFSGATNFWLHAGTYENSNGQVHFQAINSGPSQLYFDALWFSPLSPLTFSDSTQGHEFQIFYYML